MRVFYWITQLLGDMSQSQFDTKMFCDVSHAGTFGATVDSNILGLEL